MRAWGGKKGRREEGRGREETAGGKRGVQSVGEATVHSGMHQAAGGRSALLGGMFHAMPGVISEIAQPE